MKQFFFFAISIRRYLLIQLMLSAMTFVAFSDTIPIRLHPYNNHYFEFRGEPTIIVTSGEQYGAVINPDFDYIIYLDELESKGLNYTRLFTGTFVDDSVGKPFYLEYSSLNPDSNKLIAPWARAPKDENGEYADGSTGEYYKGGNKFDLNTFDTVYFNRLKDFVNEAGQRGIIVELTLFSTYYDQAGYWAVSPLKRSNNVNEIGDCSMEYVLTMATDGYPEIPNDLLPVMYSLIDKIVDELKDYDNVIYETCNEPFNPIKVHEYINPNGEHCSGEHVSTEWQAHMAQRLIVDQDSFPPAHLVSHNITGSYDSVFVIATDVDPDSVDDFRKVYPEIGIYSFHYSPNQRHWLHWVIDYNYDRLQIPFSCDETGQLSDGSGGWILDDATYRKQAWNFLIAGGALFNNLDYSFTTVDEDGTVPSTVWVGGSQALRTQYGILKDFIHGFDFVDMQPYLPFTLTGTYNDIIVDGVPYQTMAARVLANVGEEYAIYIEGGTQLNIVVDIPVGIYTAEWLNTKTGAIEKTLVFNHSGGERMLISPDYTIDIALGIVRNNQTVSDADLIGHWTFDETQGVELSDISGNYLTGHLVNGTLWDPNGQINGAVSCDGSNDYAEIFDNDLLDPGFDDFSVSFWINKRSPSAGWDNLWGVTKWNTGAAPGSNEWSFLAGAASTDPPAFGVESGTISTFVSSPDELPLNEWHLLTGIREDTVIKIYVDSTLKGTQTIGNVAVNNSGRNIRVANSHVNSLYTDALFDDLRIYNRAISRTEIIALMQNQGAVITPSPDTSWTRTYGGTLNDFPKSIDQTFDSGFIVAGYTYSDDEDVHENYGTYSADYWMLKLSNSGDTLWTKSLGGSKDDFAYSICQTADSGFVIAGTSNSTDNDLHNTHGSFDFWVVKLDSIGDTVWTNTYGGSSADKAYAIQQTMDEGFIVAGEAKSNDGDVFAHMGYTYSSDFWIIKINNNGDTLWTKTYGGTSDDCATSIDQTSDGGYIVAGYTESTDRDVFGNQGNSDYWLLRLNSNGDTLWTKTYGGTGDEEANSVIQTQDGGFIVAGYSESNDGDVHDNHGISDYWILKLNTSGDTLWTKSFGGSLNDKGFSLRQTIDGGYVIAGNTHSNDRDVSGNHGSNDFWLIKIDGSGNTIWSKALGGTSSDEGYCIRQTYDSGFIITGSVRSTDGDVCGNHGENDFWVVKLGPDLVTLNTQTIPLSTGWNIMSCNVTPSDSDMVSIVQPIIDSSHLIKVIDEAGGIIQNIPGIGWLNTIGNMANTEGYYTKVSENTQLELTGIAVPVPFTVPLMTGWNIMGYPLTQSQDALLSVQSLIDDDELIKVTDEAGGFIQEIPGIGWMNTISDFEPNEGYYIKVTNNTSLILDNPTVLSFGNFLRNNQQSELFSLSKKNPYLPMNIIITEIHIDGYTVQSGDEVAVFDFNQIAGAGVIDDNNKPLISIVAAMDDPLTIDIDGYTEGHLPEFRFKSINLSKSIQLVATPVFGSSVFTPLGTLVCTLEGSVTDIEEEKEMLMDLKCIPNPASDYTTIQYSLPEDGQLLLEVYDLSSHKIMTLQNKPEQFGIQQYRFDTGVLEKGIYLIKIQLRTKDDQYSEVVKFVRN